MAEPNTIFEATLLSPHPGVADARTLLTGLSHLLKGHGTDEPQVEQIDAIYGVLETSEIQVLLALRNEPLPIDGFLRSADPKRRRRLIDDLAQIACSTTVIVMANPSARHASDPTRLEALAWQMAQHLTARLITDYVFWADRNRLYSAQDFAAAPCPRPTPAPSHSLAARQWLAANPPEWSRLAAKANIRSVRPKSLAQIARQAFTQFVETSRAASFFF